MKDDGAGMMLLLVRWWDNELASKLGPKIDNRAAWLRSEESKKKSQNLKALIWPSTHSEASFILNPKVTALLQLEQLGRIMYNQVYKYIYSTARVQF